MVKPIIVAEISINHLGSLNILKKMILSAKASGADHVKLKIKDVDGYYEDDGRMWRHMKFLDYRRSLELSYDDFRVINNFCLDNGVSWFCTVHDAKGLNFIEDFEVPFYKVASSDSGVNDFCLQVIKAAARDDVPVVISIGGKTLDQVGNIVDQCEKFQVQTHLLHTVSIYPTPLGQSNVNRILELRKHFESEYIHIGYSGHEVGYSPTLLATMYGVQMIERHFTLSRDLKIHHINAALEPHEFRTMTRTINEICIERGQEPVDFHAKELDFLEGRHYE